MSELSHMSTTLASEAARAKRLLRVFAVVGVVAMLMLLGALFYLVIQQGDHLNASCRFYEHLSSAPIVAPKGVTPSRLGVEIIGDSRAAFIGQGCPGLLPAPDASFVRWAHFYRIPIETN